MNGRSRFLRWPALLVLLTLLIGCGGGSSTDTDSTDTGTVDTGSVDTGSVDTGSVDTGSVDTGSVDVGHINPIDDNPADTGSVDINPIDTSPSDSASGSGVATLSWTPPTTNLDGSVLVDLAGYKIYYGTQPGDYPNVITIEGSNLSAYVIDNLQPNTYYFAMTAYNTSGSESPHSNTASKIIR